MELVPFTPAHFPTLASWFPTEADLIQWGGSKLRFPLDDAQMYAMLATTTGDLPDHRSWIALHQGSIVGHAQLRFDWKNGVATLARVATAPAFRGRKLAVPMLNLVIAEAFSHPQLMRVELNVYAFNQPAIRTYQRLGFILEGTRRSSVAVGEERWDTSMMAMLRSEYELYKQGETG
jgi:RimJ/RimL family protein N-acetyltransferase